MSKCKKYVKGGGINPFWVMEQMGKYDENNALYRGEFFTILP